MRGKIEDPGVARLAAEGFTATETAEKLGISRQRVYQIAKRDGIRFALRSRLGPQPPRPIAFAGVQAPLNTVIVGTIAEILVAADLLSRGWRVYTPVAKHRGHDIIACREDQMITIEVRSVRRYVNGVLSRSKHHEKTISSHFAWVTTGSPIEYEPDIG